MVSACLLGDNVKYNGENNYSKDLVTFLKNHEVIKVCPEVAGGLSIPRNAAEIKDGKVISVDNGDVTKEFIEGAKKTLEMALQNNIKIAILKKNSPSCGYGSIYDGTFSHTIIEGYGVTAKLLRKHGIVILNEENYKEYKW